MTLIVELNIDRIWEYPRSPNEQAMLEFSRVLKDIEEDTESRTDGTTLDSKGRIVCKWRIE